MTNSITKHTFFNVVAIASMFYLPCVATAQEGPGSLAFLEGFWNSAWGLQFVPEQSAMLLEDSGGDAWQVLVTDTEVGDEVVAEGLFMEAERLLLESLAFTQEELDEASIISFDYYVVAGSITGSTGFEAALYGLAMEVVVPDPEPEHEPVLVHIFTPLWLADDVASAVSMAYDLWNSCEGFVPFPAERQRMPGIPSSWDTTRQGSLGVPFNDGGRCDQEYQDCKDQANSDFAGCMFYTSACVGLWWTGPGMAACALAVSATCAETFHVDLENCKAERDVCEGM